MKQEVLDRSPRDWHFDTWIISIWSFSVEILIYCHQNVVQNFLFLKANISGMKWEICRLVRIIVHWILFYLYSKRHSNRPGGSPGNLYPKCLQPEIFRSKWLWPPHKPTEIWQISALHYGQESVDSVNWGFLWSCSIYISNGVSIGPAVLRRISRIRASKQLLSVPNGSGRHIDRQESAKSPAEHYGQASSCRSHPSSAVCYILLYCVPDSRWTARHVALTCHPSSLVLYCIAFLRVGERLVVSLSPIIRRLLYPALLLPRQSVNGSSCRSHLSSIVSLACVPRRSVNGSSCRSRLSHWLPSLSQWL